ncbi:hypothetical protein GQ457_01G037070 [Hibiscus cannabinus]
MGNNHLHNDMIPWLQRARFYHATFIYESHLVSVLITALIVRWRSETHTFHMLCGECTITLEDMIMLIGVLLKGSPLVKQIEDSPASLCLEYFKEVPSGTGVKGSNIKLSWSQRESSSVKIIH